MLTLCFFNPKINHKVGNMLKHVHIYFYRVDPPRSYSLETPGLLLLTVNLEEHILTQ